MIPETGTADEFKAAAISECADIPARGETFRFFNGYPRNMKGLWTVTSLNDWGVVFKSQEIRTFYAVCIPWSEWKQTKGHGGALLEWPEEL